MIAFDSMGYVIPQAPVEPPAERELDVVATCVRCGDRIFAGEVYGMGSKGPVCPDCLETQWQRLPMPQRYETLGMFPVEG